MRSLLTDYQEFIHKSRYARWNELHQRREDWEETVKRYFTFFLNHLEAYHRLNLTEHDDFAEMLTAVASLEVMPSMRCLMTAGRALERDNVAGYNCCYVPINSSRSFDEILYILMCGTGVGFSVERQYIADLPMVPSLRSVDRTIIVRDSKLGWAEALKELLSSLWRGEIPKWDTSGVRSAGARLKTMGGRASGPAPLEALFAHVVSIFQTMEGRKLTSLECHDLVCKIAEVVVVGGVRRSALISLSNLSDLRMRDAKAGQWWTEHPERALANNSVAYTDGRPDPGRFMEEWLALYRSKSGERGIFNRDAARRQAVRNGRRDSYPDFGTNPCNEIILRGREFCNLSEVVARPDDTFDTLARKVRYAATLGTWQSTLTRFRYLSRQYARNCEEERLLGVSLTGIMDCPLLNSCSASTKEILNELKNVAIIANRNWADRLGIRRSTAVTCVKPSGTVSQLCNAASGIHPRYAPYYIRRVRQADLDPLTHFLKDRAFPHESDTQRDGHTIFSFPIRSPLGAVTRSDLTAVQHLKLWQFYQENWCEHKPSITVSVRENEWLACGAWVYENFDQLSGVSFLPYSEHSYIQAPFEEVSEERLVELEGQMPPQVDWDGLAQYEQEDNTTGGQEIACSSGVCEL